MAEIVKKDTKFKPGNQFWKNRKPPSESFLAALRDHTDEALKVIADLMRNAESEKVRLSAATAILDRCFGRPAQEMKISRDNAPDPTKLAQLLLSQARDGAIEIINDNGVTRLAISQKAIDVTPSNQSE